MKIIKSIIIIVALLITGLNLMAQNQPLEDVVYLKNGSIVRGQIMEQNPDGQLTIKIMGGSLFVYDMSEVERIVKEPSQNPEDAPKPKKDIYIKQKGYKSINEFGLSGASTTSYGQNSLNLAITLQTINGYQFFPQLYVAAGVGIDVYPQYDQMFTPFFLSVGGELLKKHVSPVWFANVGYAPEWIATEDSLTDVKGGFMQQYGVGIKVNTSGKVGFILHLSYKTQKSKTVQHYAYTEDFYQTINRKYQRIAFTLGMSF